jgi:hypothetical protein
VPTKITALLRARGLLPPIWYVGPVEKSAAAQGRPRVDARHGKGKRANG